MLVDERPEWHARALCAGETTLFFPDDAAGLPRAHTDQELFAIMDLCVACPVFDACAAAGEGQDFGVWAGEVKTAGELRAR